MVYRKMAKLHKIITIMFAFVFAIEQIGFALPDSALRPIASRVRSAIENLSPKERLLEDLNSDNPYIVRDAVDKLGAMRCAEAVRPLIGLLINEDFLMLRLNIINALIAIGKPSVEPLLELLKESTKFYALERGVRQHIFEILRKIKDPEARFFASLGLYSSIRKQKNKEKSVRWIVKQKDKWFNELIKLIEALDFPKDLCCGAIYVLGIIRDTKAVKPLLELSSRTPDPLIQRTISEALGKIGDPEVVEHLLNELVFYNWESRQETAAEALGNMPHPKAQFFYRLYSSYKGNIGDIVKEGAENIPLIIDALDCGYYKIYIPAAEVLKRLGEPAIEPIREALKSRSLIDKNRGRYGDPRVSVQEVLDKILGKDNGTSSSRETKSTSGLPAAEIQQSGPPRIYRRIWIDRPTKGIIDEKSIDNLISVLLNCPNYNMREQAAVYLLKLGRSAALDIAKHPQRTAILFALLQFWFYGSNIWIDFKNNIDIFVTTRCPFDCEPCIAKIIMKDLPQQDLSFEALKKVLVEIDGLPSLSFFGGEPFSYRRGDKIAPEAFLEVLDLACKHVKQVYVDTNLFYFPEDEKRLRAFLDRLPDNTVLVVSLDEWHYKEMGRRGRDVSKVISGIERYVQQKQRLDLQYNFRAVSEEFWRNREFKNLVQHFYRLPPGTFPEGRRFFRNHLLGLGGAIALAKERRAFVLPFDRKKIRRNSNIAYLKPALSIQGELLTSFYSAYMSKPPKYTVLGDVSKESIFTIMARHTLKELNRTNTNLSKSQIRDFLRCMAEEENRNLQSRASQIQIKPIYTSFLEAA